MTMTVSPQHATDEIQIIRTPPTIAEAQLIVQMQMSDAISGADRGHAVLRSFETPPTLGQLRKKYPRGSDEHRYVMHYLGSCETTATFVKQGILSEELVNDLYAVKSVWQVAEKACKGVRRESGEPRMFENFEWLASRAP
jgi:hypothetical protein